MGKRDCVCSSPALVLTKWNKGPALEMLPKAKAWSSAEAQLDGLGVVISDSK